MRKILALLVVAGLGASCAPEPATSKKPDPEPAPAEEAKKPDAAAMREAIANQKKPEDMSEEDWKKKLSDEQYLICRLGGTERPFTGALLNNKKKGTYTCVACENELFTSETKFDSGTGWPSFYDPADTKSLKKKIDTSHGMVRTEVSCLKCGSHLGHVFNDGPLPTGQRYCINSIALKFVEAKDAGEPEEKK